MNEPEVDQNLQHPELEALTEFMEDRAATNDNFDWALYECFKKIYLNSQDALEHRRAARHLINVLCIYRFHMRLERSAHKFIRVEFDFFEKDACTDFAIDAAVDTLVYFQRNCGKYDIREFRVNEDKPIYRLSDAIFVYLHKRLQGAVRDLIKQFAPERISLDKKLGNNDDSETRLEQISEIPATEFGNPVRLSNLGQLCRQWVPEEAPVNPAEEDRRLVNEILLVLGDRRAKGYPKIRLADIAERTLLRDLLNEKRDFINQIAQDYGIEPASAVNTILYDEVIPFLVFEVIFKEILIPGNHRDTQIVKDAIKADRKSQLHKLSPKNKPDCNLHYLCRRRLPLFRNPPSYEPMDFSQIAEELATKGCNVTAARVEKFWESRDSARLLFQFVKDAIRRPATLKDYIYRDPRGELKGCHLPKREEINAQFLAVQSLIYKYSWDRIYVDLVTLYPKYRLYGKEERKAIIERTTEMWQTICIPLLKRIIDEYGYSPGEFNL